MKDVNSRPLSVSCITITRHRQESLSDEKILQLKIVVDQKNVFLVASGFRNAAKMQKSGVRSFFHLLATEQQKCDTRAGSSLCFNLRSAFAAKKLAHRWKILYHNLVHQAQDVKIMALRSSETNCTEIVVVRNDFKEWLFKSNLS